MSETPVGFESQRPEAILLCCSSYVSDSSNIMSGHPVKVSGAMQTESFTQRPVQALSDFYVRNGLCEFGQG